MSLISLFKGLQKGWLKDVLTGAGLTLGTAAINLTALNTVITKFKSDLNGIPSDLLGLASLAGIDVAISITLGAIVTRHALSSTKLTLKKI